MRINCDFKLDEFFDKIEGEREISFLVIHHTQANSIKESVDLYKEHGVSAHYLIDEKGEVFRLVDDCDVAYHAGISYWNGIDGINKTSIGVELVCSRPFEKGYSDIQMDALVKLCRGLKDKYSIDDANIVGHSDIAYFADNGCLDRKQDPSHLFDWKRMFVEGLAVDPSIFENIGDFTDDMEDERIFEFKKKAKAFGYKMSNLSNSCDDEMKGLLAVVERRFLR